mmetsp:Transcript_5726/g.19195  ORF Transcript_5726/g.19195 Transcript_5726/m.19195 type:complete len:120 (-) Transcript_5726:72-431(-)
MFMQGVDEGGAPLTPQQMFEDVVADYQQRTVTMEPHPHLSKPHLSVHPCQHGAVMKRLVANMSSGGRTPHVRSYMFIFLKFIASVVPTLEYDVSFDEVLGRTVDDADDGDAGEAKAAAT